MLNDSIKQAVKRAAIDRSFKKYKTPGSLAEFFLKGWAFEGVAAEQHKQEVETLAQIARDARKEIA